MKKYFACVQNEWTKLIHKKKYIVFLIIGICLLCFNIFGRLLISKLSGMTLSISGGGTSMSMISLFIAFFIPLIAMMSVCDLFSAEIQDQTVKAILMRPVSRFKIYLGKLTASALLAFMYIAVLLVASVLLDAAAGKKTIEIFYPTAAYLIDLVPIIIVILMAAFINQLTKSSTMSMFLCIIVYMLLYIIGIFIPAMGGLLFTGYMKWHTIWLGHMLPFGALASKTALLVGYALTFFSGGYLMFAKQEF